MLVTAYFEIVNCRKNSLHRRRVKSLAALEKNRKKFINDYNLKLKAEFWKPPDFKEYITEDLRDSQVVAIMQDYHDPNVYHLRKDDCLK